MPLIDLRSDTVTKPTPEMRAAIAAAELGDDVYGEDPTVNRLQDLAAALLGKEAALLVPTGTMGNLASILAHCGRGEEVILGNLSHTYLLEAGGMAALGGVHPRVLLNRSDGTLDLTEIESAVRTDDPHFPVTRLISLESTHNRCRGSVLPIEYIEKAGELARKKNLKLHLDGARFFNAAVSLGVSPAAYAAPFDSVTFCLSKALCAPVGSVIVGDQAFIRRAHRARKVLGGGMRQAGVIAAAGIVALQTMVERLADDHKNARTLAGKLSDVPGLVVENPVPESNMVYFRLSDEVRLTDDKLMAILAKRNILIHDVAHRRYRLVTHYWITPEMIDFFVDELSATLAN